MQLDDKNSVYAECEKLGESAVRSMVEAGSFGGHSAYHRQWLLEKAEERLRMREAEDKERNERALAAAESSAAASERAALSAKDSARWTMWAAVIALLSIVVQQFLK
jgi:hypothetical protein